MHIMPADRNSKRNRQKHSRQPVAKTYKLTHLQTRIDVYKYSFLPRTIIQWNQLQIPVNNIDIDTFKNTLINIM